MILTHHSGEWRGAGTGRVIAEGRAKPLRVAETKQPFDLDSGWECMCVGKWERRGEMRMAVDESYTGDIRWQAKFARCQKFHYKNRIGLQECTKMHMEKSIYNKTSTRWANGIYRSPRRATDQDSFACPHSLAQQHGGETLRVLLGGVIVGINIYCIITGRMSGA